MVCYDPRNMTWDEYCKLMTELFAPNQLGYVTEENWRGWVDAMTGIGNFSNSGIPDSRGFESWQDWAKQMVGILNLGA